MKEVFLEIMDGFLLQLKLWSFIFIQILKDRRAKEGIPVLYNCICHHLTFSCSQEALKKKSLLLYLTQSNLRLNCCKVTKADI